MRTQTFYDWLTREVATSRMALIEAYECRDRLLYVEAPPLRQRYMDKIGVVEEAVLEAELEVSMLRRKAEMLQIAVNRRESIDLEKIDRELEREREQQVAELEQKDLTLHELPQLTEQQAHTIQRQYREITSNFHPAMNPDATDTQRELYEKAMEAYKMQDVEAMKAIYDSLFLPVDEVAYTDPNDSKVPAPEVRRENYRTIASELATDYYLAKKLYDCFAPLEEDRVMLDALRSYDDQRQAVEDEIQQIRNGFPFNAAATMDDPAKTNAYLAELQVRASRCEEEKSELEKKIAALTEGRSDG